jgi:hypothetical protein
VCGNIKMLFVRRQAMTCVDLTGLADLAAWLAPEFAPSASCRAVPFAIIRSAWLDPGRDMSTWSSTASASGTGAARVTLANTSKSPITPVRRTGYRDGSLTDFSVHKTLPSGRVIVSAEEYRSYSNSSPP